MADRALLLRDVVAFLLAAAATYVCLATLAPDGDRPRPAPPPAPPPGLLGPTGQQYLLEAWHAPHPPGFYRP